MDTARRQLITDNFLEWEAYSKGWERPYQTQARDEASKEKTEHDHIVAHMRLQMDAFEAGKADPNKLFVVPDDGVFIISGPSPSRTAEPETIKTQQRKESIILHTVTPTVPSALFLPSARVLLEEAMFDLPNGSLHRRLEKRIRRNSSAPKFQIRRRPEKLRTWISRPKE